jgi:hypothetical protein
MTRLRQIPEQFLLHGAERPVPEKERRAAPAARPAPAGYVADNIADRMFDCLQ